MTVRIITLVRCYEMEINVEKYKVMRISRLTYLLIYLLTFFLHGTESLRT